MEVLADAVRPLKKKDTKIIKEEDTLFLFRGDIIVYIELMSDLTRS